MPKEITHYNKLTNTYRGLPIVWANIQKFQMMFLEAQCSLNEVGLMRDDYRREKDTYTAKQAEEKLAEIDNRMAEVKGELEGSYKCVWGLRRQIRRLYEGSPDYKIAIDNICKDDPVLWINTFAWTYDPRLNSVGIPSKLPLVLFPKQEECIRIVDQCMSENRSYMIEKSRAEGLTEILCALDIHHWIYHNGFKGGWGSRTEDMVDKHDDPDTIFVRLRRIIYNLPIGMKPPAYNNRRNRYDNLMRIVNPLNGNSITGDGGANIGRGGRATTYKVDEAAALEHPTSTDEALSYTTNCQGDISTPNGMNHFYNKIASGKVERITMGWWFNPSKNPEWRTGNRSAYSPWYELEKRKRDEVLLAKEVDINYQASVDGVMIPPKWVLAAVDFDCVVDESVKIGAFDPAAGGADESAYMSRTGIRLNEAQISPKKTPLEATWDIVEFAEADGINLLSYDRNTIGEDVYPLLTMGERKPKFRLDGIYGQSAASDTYIESEDKFAYEKFRNRRGELWWNLRKRFEKTYQHVNGIAYYPLNELISIPNDPILITEFSAPLMVHSASGKIGVESKLEMRRRGVKSPNRADCGAYLFSSDEDTAEIVDSFDYSDEMIVCPWGYNKTAAHEIFCSIWMTEDNRLFVVPIQYFLGSEIIRVIGERIIDGLDPKEVRGWIKELIDNPAMDVTDWIGNDKMFEGLLEGKLTTWYDFQKEDIPLTQDYRNDHAYAVDLLNSLFEMKLLQVNDQCTGIVNHLRNWRKKRGKIQKDMFYGEALVQVVSLLHEKKRIVRAVAQEEKRRNGYH